MKGVSLEAKVGLLVLTAAIVLGAFLFILGGVSFEDTFSVEVDFDNPGSVQPGAAVRIGGVKVGTVESVTYLGRRLDPATGRRALVRMRLSIHERVRDTIHEGSLFYVTSQGVLGEQFVAIDPGDPEGPLLDTSRPYVGVDPPRLDLALALGFEVLEMLHDAVRDNRDDLGALFEDVVALVHQLRLLVTDNRGDLDTIVGNVRTLSEEGITTLRSAREAYVDGERPRRIMANVDRTVAVVSRETPTLIQDVERATRGVNDVLDTFGPDQRRQIQTTIASAERIATSAEGAVNEAGQIVHGIREGRGTVGALLMDEEIYDDLQELIRDLKHNPWKFFWRE
ncbi:MAG: MCE family protein [Sandaracinaceae bacterium]|nr:MCE family protein [Sandaracinaceae bacterium]